VSNITFTDEHGEYIILRAVRNGRYNEVYIDICDINQLKHNWHISKRGYVERSKRINGKMTAIKLHRDILGITDPNIKVDHIDGNKLNCRRHNMRTCTNQQNGMNTKIYSNNTSGHKGVSWNKNMKKWHPKIMVDGVTINLGLYDNIEDAIKIRRDAEIQYFGEFRRDCNGEVNI